MSTITDARRTDWWQALWGGLLIAAGDAVFATLVWFDWTMAGQMKLFQTIAVGVLGKASYAGGMAAALLGLGLHVFMATVFVVVCIALSFRLPILLRRPYLSGVAYGVLLYVVMNFVVMPLSRVGASPSFKHLDSIAMSVVAHMIFGVICTLFARRARAAAL